ncbi:hypothetical protein BDZ45DRAFT_801147 [Acephala macrosclerotiorum]|nr:hypothetical protein BDZ45DRAFT_801147 [Acephala macrosclerotiorum]
MAQPNTASEKEVATENGSLAAGETISNRGPSLSKGIHMAHFNESEGTATAPENRNNYDGAPITVTATKRTHGNPIHKLLTLLALILLPIELRLKIWDEGMPGQLLVELLSGGLRLPQLHKNCETPAILHVCQESHYHALKEYRTIVALAEGSTRRWTKQLQYHYVNLGGDLLYLSVANMELFSDTDMNGFGHHCASLSFHEQEKQIASFGKLTRNSIWSPNMKSYEKFFKDRLVKSGVVVAETLAKNLEFINIIRGRAKAEGWSGGNERKVDFGADTSPSIATQQEFAAATTSNDPRRAWITSVSTQITKPHIKDSATLDYFTLFPTLPIELRLQIFDAITAAAEPRVIEVVWNEAQGFHASTPTPVLLHVCAESRSHVLSKYSKVVVKNEEQGKSENDSAGETSNSSSISDSLSTRKRTTRNFPSAFCCYIDYKHDSLYLFMGTSGGHEEYEAKTQLFMDKLDFDTISKLQHMVFDNPMVLLKLEKSALSRLKNLRTLSVVSTDKCQVWFGESGKKTSPHRLALGLKRKSRKELEEQAIVCRWSNTNRCIEDMDLWKTWKKLLKDMKPEWRQRFLENGADEAMVGKLDYGVVDVIRGEAGK